jgi:hypothetical protein
MQSRGQRRVARPQDQRAGRGTGSGSRFAVAISMFVFGVFAVVG